VFRGSTVTVPVLSCPVQRGRGKGSWAGGGPAAVPEPGGATPPRLVIAPGRVVRRPASGQAIPHHGGRCSVSCFAFVCSPIHLAAGCCRLSYRSTRPERVGTKGQHLDLGSTGQRIDDDRTGPADRRPDEWFALASFVRSRRGRRRVTFATCADGRRASGRRGRRDAGSCVEMSMGTRYPITRGEFPY
jgi:hypothetical protein